MRGFLRASSRLRKLTSLWIRRESGDHAKGARCRSSNEATSTSTTHRAHASRAAPTSPSSSLWNTYSSVPSSPHSLNTLRDSIPSVKKRRASVSSIFAWPILPWARAISWWQRLTGSSEHWLDFFTAEDCRQVQVSSRRCAPPRAGAEGYSLVKGGCEPLL